MAEEPIASAQESYDSQGAIHNLRALAQSNLATIEAEDSVESAQQAMTAHDLQKYAKARRKDRPSTSQPQALETKRPKLRSAQDVLDRLRYDPQLHIAEYSIGYLERFEGIREMPATSWISESTDEDWIPQHRIKYVKRTNATGQEEVVWDRETRLDKIFGSGERSSQDPDGSEYGGVAIS